MKRFATHTAAISAALLLIAGCGDKETVSDDGSKPAATAPAPTKPTQTKPPASSARKLLGVGSAAPNFTLPAHDGQTIELAKLTGPVILYFYPKDETPG